MATSASLGRPPARLLTPPRPPPPALLTPSSQCGTHPASAARLLFLRPLLAFPGEDRVAPQEEENWTKKNTNYMNPCKLYVCNLPSSFQIGDLARLFGYFGNVTAILVSRNPSTGQSRGAAYVTMGTLVEARKAVAALEGSVGFHFSNNSFVSLIFLSCLEVGRREIRVRYAADMKHSNSKIEKGRWWELNPNAVTNQIYEGRYKLYAGNLESSLVPEDVKEVFSEFGTVVSAMLVKDHRTGRSRCYAFVTYNTEKELEAALSVNGQSIAGRVISVRRLKDDWIKGGPSSAH